jgi:GINS complex protein
MASSTASGCAASRLSLCNQSSFCAENTVVTVVPSFHCNDAPLPLLSSPHQRAVGPFVAGLPTEVPLWMAKALHQRNLAQIHLPDWLSTESLSRMLKEERESTFLTANTTLPYYYYEIARSLNFCTPRPSQILLQDLTALRCDKLRQHFHELSRTELSRPRGVGGNDDDDDANDDGDGNNPNELPMISVTGIASYEINKVGPFLQRAFSDYGFLTRRSLDADNVVGGSNGDGGRGVGTGRGKDETAGSSDSRDKGGGSGIGGGVNNESQSQDTSTRKMSMARSRLRRFRS